MKLLRMLMPLVLITLLITTGRAQTEEQPEFNDEDLKRYAITMDSVDAMKENLRAVVTEMVQTNTVMSVARYNELFKIADDSAKLQAANATPEEIDFVKKVEARRQEEIAKINANYQALAKDFVGLKQFNAIRKSVKEDEEVKAKLDTISKELDSKGS